jgi:hypothetical protein
MHTAPSSLAPALLSAKSRKHNFNVSQKKVFSNSLIRDDKNSHPINISVKCALANVRSMNNKANIIADFILQHNLDIMFITESWMRDTDEDNFIFHKACPPSYKYFNIPRLGKKGGGIAIICNDKVKISALSTIATSSFSTFEHALFSFSSTKTIVCCLIYRPPGTSISHFMSELSDLCSTLIAFDEIILLGDFNVSHLFQQHNTGNNNELSDVIDTFSLVQHVNAPTHSCGGVLDLIFTRRNSSTVRLTDIVEGLSDHQAILFDLFMHLPSIQRHNAPTFITRRLYGRLDISAFECDISCAFHDILNNTTSAVEVSATCNELVLAYDNTVKVILDLHAPNKVIKSRAQKSLPWFNSNLLVYRRAVRKAERLWRQSKLEVHRSIYVSTKSAYHNALNEAASTYLTTSLEKAAHNTKKMWSVLNSALGRISCTILPEHDDLKSLADEFNRIFLEKPAKIHYTISQSSSSPTAVVLRQPNEDITSSPSSRHQLANFNSISMRHIKHLLCTSPSKSSVLDPLPAWLLRRCSDVFIPLLTTIVNSAIQHGMPPHYKTSCVTPLIKKKKGDRNDFTNYRPVSNLPYVSKLVERAIAKQITDHLSTGNYFDPHQYAYRRHHSCESALLHVLNIVYSSIDDKKVVLLVLLDLSSAFDTIDHSVLSSRLIECGIVQDAHKWIMGYLSDRHQFINCKGTFSSTMPVRYGVPQGSVLGPLIFNIYLTGLRDIVLSHEIDYVCYADDLQLIMKSSVADLTVSLAKLETCIADIKQWYAASFLALNDAKTEFLILGSPAMIKKLPEVSIRVGSFTIKPSSSVRDLGVLLDPSLSFHGHIKSVCSRSFSSLRIIAKIKRMTTQHHRHLLIHALVLSHIDYCSALFLNIPHISAIKIQRVINAAFRFLFNIKKSSSCRQPLKEKGWLPFQQRCLLRVASITNIALNTGSPIHLKNLLQLQLDSRLRSCSQGLLSLSRSRTMLGGRSFQCCAPGVWNNIPLAVRNSISFRTFQVKLKEFLLSTMNDA